jgi:hypothetical protein
MLSIAMNIQTEVLLVVTPFTPVVGQWEQIQLSLYMEHFPELYPINTRKYMLPKDKNKISKNTPFY